MQRLILFDVDLTLIDTTECNLLAFNSAFEQAHGHPRTPLTSLYLTVALTCPLMTEMYRKWGITQPDSMTFPDLSEFTTVYFDHLAKGLENWTEGYSCPGAREILEALAREPGVQLGLETGNFREAAFIKLRKFGMDVFFEEGGFGGDWTTRMEVVADAIAKCQALESTIYERGNIFVIGDSISDVKAGQANGINSVAVATGHYNMGKLASLNPTYIFPDLSDTAKVLEALLG